MAQQKNRRNALIAALAVLVVALAVGGTIAWLTANDTLESTFTVGSIGKPTHPSNPDHGGDEDEKEDDDNNEIDGYLFETEWDEEDTPELSQGVYTPKNPNVGISTSGHDAFVFLYVHNDSVAEEGTLANDAPYFFLEDQWTAMNTTIAGENDTTGIIPTVATNLVGSEHETEKHAGETAYADGLFMYTGDQMVDSLPTVLSVSNPGLNNSGETASNVYTGELFEDITIPNDIDVTEVLKSNGKITVYAFIYAYDAEAQEGDGTAEQALAEAISWAKDMKAEADK